MRALVPILALALALPAHAQRSLGRIRRVQQDWPRLTAQIGGRTLSTFSFDGHVHTDHSRDARHPTGDVLFLAALADLDALVITDHGSSHATQDLDGYRGDVAVLVGEEVGGPFGHAVIWNVPERRGVQDARETLRDLGAHVHAQGGVLVLAHPGWWMTHNTYDPRRWMDPQSLRRGGISENVDALELWNAVYYQRSRELLDQWVALLEQGIFVPIVGGSDFHVYGAHFLGTPRNVFSCAVDRDGRPATPLGECLLEAVRRGRLFVSDGPVATLDVAGHTMGEVLGVRPGAELRVQVRAVAPRGGQLRVFLGRNVAGTLDLPPGEERSRIWTLRAPAEDSFVRVEIERATPVENATSFSLVSNPVLLDVGPARASWRGQDEGRLAAPPGYRRPGDRSRPNLSRRARSEEE
ncbi:MAG: PHP domain-containing protein [Sandaracinaceae bacterium]|nr:PHP domain-containing protein [Sandaracinaceae bacterium]